MSLASRAKMRLAHLGHKHSKKTKLKMSRARIGKKMSETTKRLISAAQKGELNHAYKAESTNYWTIHRWLLRTYGKAKNCELCGGAKKSKRCEWALIKGKKHQRKRENYWQLCKSCHNSYDGIIKNITNSK